MDKRARHADIAGLEAPRKHRLCLVQNALRVRNFVYQVAVAAGVSALSVALAPAAMAAQEAMVLAEVCFASLLA